MSLYMKGRHNLLTNMANIDIYGRISDEITSKLGSFGDVSISEMINASQDKKDVTIIFENCGNTIPREKLSQIFEQFYRLDAARSTSSGGAGLGLAIAKQIVELHKGTITAESTDEKIRFTVTLPLS